MKKQIVLILLVTFLLFIGCGIDRRPPEYSVHNPNAVPDGFGGVIVTYQMNIGNKATT
jgi:hypothetical protein